MIVVFYVLVILLLMGLDRMERIKLRLIPAIIFSMMKLVECLAYLGNERAEPQPVCESISLANAH